MVGLEQRLLEIGTHAARPLQAVDGGHEGVLARRGPSACPVREEIAEGADVLR